MSRMGLLIDYQYCCGCHTCEVACQREHNLNPNKWGIKVSEIGPFEIDGTDKVVYNFVPSPTDLCDLCAARTNVGKLPTCVHHCQTGCMSYGPVEELVKEMGDKPKQAMFFPF